MRKITFLMLLAFVTLVSNAQISRYVKVTATGAGNGTSWVDAAGTADIQTMIGQVAADANKGTVYFAAGTYSIAATIDIKNGVQMKGGYAADGSGVRDLVVNQTILDGQNARRILKASDSENPAFSIVTVIDGFVLQRGSSSYGSAAVVSLGTVLENCIIRNNTGSTIGAAIFMKKNTAIPNTSPQNTYKNFKVSGALINCVIVNNSSSNVSAAVWAADDSHFSIVNCVIANNKSTDATNGVGGIWFGNNIHYTQIQNTIFYNNSGAAANNIKTTSSALRVTLNNWFDNATMPITLGAGSDNNKTSTDIASPNFALSTGFQGSTTDPIKISELEAADWRLKSTSGLIGLGNSTQGIKFPYENMNASTVATPTRAFNTISTDIMGSNRTINTTVEMGAYEYNPIVVTTASADINKGTVSANVTVSKGSSAALVATPVSGYKFSKWNDGTSDVSTSATYSFVPTADVTLTATFEVDLGTGVNNVTNNRFVVVNNKKLTIAETGQLLVYNATGKLVVDKYIVGETVSVEKTGVYFVKLRTESGVRTQKVLVD